MTPPSARASSRATPVEHGELRVQHIVPSLLTSGGVLVVHESGRRVELSWREVALDVARAARWLEDRGVGPGSRVALHAAPSRAWLVADLALLARGAVSVPFDRAGPPPSGDARRRYGLALVLGDGAPEDAGPSAPIDAWTAAGGPAPPLECARFAPEEPYTVKLSSGSSGPPKAVLARALHFESMARHVAEQFSLGPSDRYLAVFPLTVWLQRFLVHLSILVGADVILGPVERAARLLKTERPTFMIGVPRLFEAMYRLHASRAGDGETAGFGELWGGRMRALWTGSAPIARAVLDFYGRAGVPIYEGYGMTETGMIAKNHPGACRAGSVGRPFPDKRIEIDDAGQVLVHSRHLPSETYLSGPERDLGVFRGGGCVATGDLGHLDADGFLYLTGRLSETLVLTSGKKVQPAAIEARLFDPALMERIVVCGQGRPYLSAVIVPRDASVTRERLRAHVDAVQSGGPAHERVCGLLVTHERFDAAGGLLTSTEKLNRAAVEARFGPALEAQGRPA